MPRTIYPSVGSEDGNIAGSVITFSSAKFALRGLAQALAREFWPSGIHIAHIVVDGVIGEWEIDWRH
jgi:NAD(P)-dependent dehydrogenase (short-subunit alcohol dehydrogenase family)